MIQFIRQVFQTWLIKYWIIVLSALIIGFSGAVITWHVKKSTKVYTARVYGCTLLLNYQSLFIYLENLMSEIKNEQYKEASVILGLKPENLENIKSISITTVEEVAEESEVRYEFQLAVTMENDTSGLFALEKSLIDIIKNNALILSLEKDKEWIYLENKKIVDSEFLRIDSILKTLPESRIADREILQKRKTELKIHLNELMLRKRNVYDVKIIQSSKKTITEELPNLYALLKEWIGISVLTSLLFVFFYDKKLRERVLLD